MRDRKEAAPNFLPRFMAGYYILTGGISFHTGFTNTMVDVLSLSPPHSISFSLSHTSLFLIKLKIKSRAQARACLRSLARSLARSAAIFRRICNLYLCIGDSFARFKFDGFFLFGRFNYSNTA